MLGRAVLAVPLGAHSEASRAQSCARVFAGAAHVRTHPYNSKPVKLEHLFIPVSPTAPLSRQNSYFTANCMMRWVPAFVVIRPNCAESKFVVGLPQLKLLSRLKASRRILGIPHGARGAELSRDNAHIDRPESRSVDTVAREDIAIRAGGRLPKGRGQVEVIRQRVPSIDLVAHEAGRADWPNPV